MEADCRASPRGRASARPPLMIRGGRLHTSRLTMTQPQAPRLSRRPPPPRRARAPLAPRPLRAAAAARIACASQKRRGPASLPAAGAGGWRRQGPYPGSAMRPRWTTACRGRSAPPPRSTPALPRRPLLARAPPQAPPLHRAVKTFRSRLLGAVRPLSARALSRGSRARPAAGRPSWSPRCRRRERQATAAAARRTQTAQRPPPRFVGGRRHKRPPSPHPPLAHTPPLGRSGAGEQRPWGAGGPWCLMLCPWCLRPRPWTPVSGRVAVRVVAPHCRSQGGGPLSHDVSTAAAPAAAGKPIKTLPEPKCGGSGEKMAGHRRFFRGKRGVGAFERRAPKRPEGRDSNTLCVTTF